ncbi:MAG: MBL fold metallo-hydrolase [Candidatus Freyarchaeota archaeon]
MGVSFRPVWFDSLGAKSSCTLVETPEVSVLIDPGIAVMQPSFPASMPQKLYWEAMGRREIKRASRKADVIVVSHYHYDHYFPEDMSVYSGKLVLAKNPNEYINDSQRRRAERFYSKICKHFGKTNLEDVVKKPYTREYGNPLDDLPIAMHKDFGDYNERRKELLEKGLKWFRNRTTRWGKNPEIPELEFESVKVKYPEGRKLRFGDTRLRFTKPLFHGIEFSRVGWIFATVVEHGGEKLIHSSDMNGPIIEDYAEWIIEENPDILVLDGPMTYMFGYLLNRTNLNRTVANAVRILEETKARLIIYDHHLPREAKFKEHTREVWNTAEKLNKKLLTAADFLRKTPKVLMSKRD